MPKIDHVFFILKALKEIFSKKDIEKEKEKYGVEIRENSIALNITDLRRTFYLKLTENGLKIDIQNFFRKDPDITVQMSYDTLMCVVDGRIKKIDKDGKECFDDYDIWKAWSWDDIVTFGEGSTNLGKKALEIIDDNIGEIRDKIRHIRGE